MKCKILVLVMLLFSFSSGSADAQEILKAEFITTFQKNFKFPRDIRRHSFFSIKFTTNKEGKITKMELSDNTNSLIVTEFNRIRPLLDLKSMERFVLADSEALLPVICIHQNTPPSVGYDPTYFNMWDFRGNERYSEKYQMLPPIVVDRYARGTAINN